MAFFTGCTIVDIHDLRCNYVSLDFYSIIFHSVKYFFCYEVHYSIENT